MRGTAETPFIAFLLFSGDRQVALPLDDPSQKNEAFKGSKLLSPSFFPSPLALRVCRTIRRDPIGWASSCGLTFVVVLPRQSGKNELQAHIFSWLLFRYAHLGGRIVSVSPTFKPQTANNMDRVRLFRNSVHIGTAVRIPSMVHTMVHIYEEAPEGNCSSFEPQVRMRGSSFELLSATPRTRVRGARDIV